MERHNGLEQDPEGAFVYHDDAQATIAALQDERDGWVRSREHYYQLWMRATDERDEMRKERDEFESLLAQRTAELEAIETILDIDSGKTTVEKVRDLHRAFKQVWESYQDASNEMFKAQAELERVRDQFADLRKMVAALPKVEGEITEDSSDHGGEIRDGNGYVHYYATSRAKVRALLQVLQHRQGMEG